MAFPDNPRVTGLRRDARMGELARAGEARALSRAAPGGAGDRALHRRRGARAVGRRAADRHLDRPRRRPTSAGSCARNREATRNYSLHTTGWAFDVARRYRSKRQALAFQFVLDRLQSLDLIAWVREPGAIHVTAAPEGKALLPLLERSTTPGMTDAIRTPDEILEGLPDFPYAPHYREVDGLRLAHIDEGDGAAGGDVARRADVVVPVAQGAAAGPRRGLSRRAAGPRRLRALGQADRARLVLLRPPRRRSAATLLEDLDLRDATFVVHDWGGPIGLRLAVEHPDRVARLVIMDTGLFTGEQTMSDAWRAVRRLRRAHRGPADRLARAARLPQRAARRGRRRLRRAVPEHASKAGARAFPLLIPKTPDAPGAAEGRRVLAALRADERPMLMLWAAEDPVLPPQVGERVRGGDRARAAPPRPRGGALPAGGPRRGDRPPDRRLAGLLVV